MTRGFLCLLLALMPLLGLAQWDEMVRLTNDNYSYFWPTAVVDDSFRLQVFAVREDLSQPLGEASTLIYQRFDSWGNPLCPQIPVLADSHWFDYGAGVLLDRQGIIHLVWCRAVRYDTDTIATFYARMSTGGEFLTPPTVLAVPDTYFVQSGISLVQRENGDIWAAVGKYFCTFSETGNLLQEPMLIVPNALFLLQSIAGAAPDGSVWAAVRFGSDTTQNVSVVRLDTTTRHAEAVSPAPPGQWLQMSPLAFYIDANGAFHYVIYRELTGEFYQRDARDGSAADTLMMDPAPFGNHTLFSVINEDTLEYLQETYQGAPGLWRWGFTLDGQRAYGPLFAPNTVSPCPRCPFQWKEGSYWVIGTTNLGIPSIPQLTMIHVPGPNEPPPSAVDEPSSYRPSPQLELSTLLQGEHLQLRIDGLPMTPGTLTLFNVLGQRVLHRELAVGDAPVLLALPAPLPSGLYFVRVKTSRGEFGGKFLRIK